MSVTERLQRRIMTGSAGGTIKSTDDTGPVHKVQLQLGPHEVTDNVPVVQLYGVASHAPKDSEAFAVFVTGDRSKGVILGTNHRDARLRNLKAGEVGLYTDEGDSVVLRRDKSIEVTCGTKVLITCPLVEMSGDLHVKGEVIRGWGGGDQVTLGQHKHTQPADAHGDGEQPTNPPVPGT